MLHAEDVKSTTENLRMRLRVISRGIRETELRLADERRLEWVVYADIDARHG